MIIKNIRNRTNKLWNEVFKNDILFPQSTTVDNRSLISPACMNDEKAQTSWVFAIRPKEWINGNFVAIYSKGNTKQHLKLAKKWQGLTIVHLYYNSIKDETIYISSLPEQEKIWSLFEQLDSHISKNQQKLEKLKNMKQSFLQKLFPKDWSALPELRFKGFEGAWEEKKFDDMWTVSMCKRIFKEETSTEWDIPFYKIWTFGEQPDSFISRELFEKYKKQFSYPENWDILLSASWTIWRLIEYKWQEAYYQDSNIVWLNHKWSIKNIFLKVLYLVVKRNWIEWSTIKRLYNSNFLNTHFNLPKTKEQEKIWAFFEKLDTQITQQTQKIQKLQNLKQSLLEKMFI